MPRRNRVSRTQMAENVARAVQQGDLATAQLWQGRLTKLREDDKARVAARRKNPSRKKSPSQIRAELLRSGIEFEQVRRIDYTQRVKTARTAWVADYFRTQIRRSLDRQQRYELELFLIRSTVDRRRD